MGLIKSAIYAGAGMYAVNKVADIAQNRQNHQRNQLKDQYHGPQGPVYQTTHLYPPGYSAIFPFIPHETPPKCFIPFCGT